jgi:hypothetical protein
MCSPLDPLSCVDAIVQGVTDGVAAGATSVVNGALGAVTDMLHEAIKAMALVLAGWLLAPSTQLCDMTSATWMQTCATSSGPAAMLRGWMLPLTVLITVAGIIWQAILMAVTRKGEPLLVILKGLASVVLWGAIGLVGTQLALRAGDAYAYWILQQAIFGDSLNPVDDVGKALAGMSVGASAIGAMAMWLLLLPFLLVTVAQIILMIFREGAVIILAGQLQLAAAGGFTRITSGWLGRVTGWMLALLAYKYVAASVYAVAFALMGDGLRNILMGLAVMLMCVIAMPALMRLFNWTVGTLGSSGGGLGVLASATAAGLHGAATMGGLGGYGPGQHARYLDEHGPGAGPAGGAAPNPGGSSGSLGGGGVAGTGAAATAAGGAAAGVATAGASVLAEQAVDTLRRAAGAAGDAMAGQ